ncbi:unnamed protein product [Polarella glacialis]|uniref:Uncharacterized protein n=1 Tax=Polarella glacialis TaxID=89957 RepID=A0A813JK48_POLGL|nr:unnamed protein product [Polarella glacialis]
MHNRRFLCLLDLLYDAVKQGRAPNTVLSLSRRLKQEMIVLCSLAPFIFCDLRASVSRDVHVVDASSKKFASCSAPINKTVSKELLRHCQEGQMVQALESYSSLAS